MTLLNNILRFMRYEQGDFNQLALDVFAYQFNHCLSYQHYCQHLQAIPETITHWHDIPSVPTDVFREFDLCTFDPTKAQYIFQTSGTTQVSKGKHFYQNMDLYDEVIRLSFMRGIGLSFTDRISFRILTPSFNEIQTSSLFYMLQQVMEWYGDTASRFYMSNNQVDYVALKRDLDEDVRQQRPIILIGTAFSYVNLFDHFTKEKWQLPSGSVLMETGGLKGKSRVITQEELYYLFESRFGLARENCFSEYGMTELSSQCYSKSGSDELTCPHWMPLRIINPETGNDVSVGETGIIQFFDLANLEAISAVTTADLGLKLGNGFKLLGRAPLAVLRGCSTQFEVYD
jgi:hypothetical protein